ncbi:twisted gastrulation protein homolog 1-A-like isoform X1 [Nasonia vitripennis]|uniref:Protein twisted gastrulation n=2 Tax=Nasonia vitripennis TaxID=7425 RepID=A0A7M7ILJ4_NASVI|nr:twisted gastrulation protein homolog 1-A-like isoform X1 [Nasonia vitripennis]
MKMLLLVLKAITITIVPLIIFSRSQAYGCNEAICASTVSKCMLINSCKCDLTTCSCCKDCFLCLSLLYDECCSCFDLCPKSNDTQTVPLSKKSHVEDFDEPFPELFRALNEEPDEHKRWNSFTYPISLPNRILSPQQEKNFEYYMQSADKKYNSKTVKLQAATTNCTVSFLAECNSWSKCKQSCQSMGATSYRWFHDGCCECIGESCINYGINESRCSNCPSETKKLVEDDYDDYGQDEDYDIMIEDI